MTEFLLIVILSFPGQPESSIPVAIIFNPAMCEIIGKGVTRGMMDAQPGLKADYECLPRAGGMV